MKEEVVPEELLAEIQRLRIQNQRMAERIAYLERLLWGGKRDKRVAQGPTLFDAFFNEAADAREAAIAETVQEIRKEAEKRRACGKKNQHSIPKNIIQKDIKTCSSSVNSAPAVRN